VYHGAVRCTANITDECAASIFKIKVIIKRKCSLLTSLYLEYTFDFFNHGGVTGTVDGRFYTNGYCEVHPKWP